MNNFGEKIKILRTRKKLKQDDIAAVLNLSRAQISNLEAGRRNVTLKQLENFASILKWISLILCYLKIQMSV